MGEAHFRPDDHSLSVERRTAIDHGRRCDVVMLVLRPAQHEDDEQGQRKANGDAVHGLTPGE